MSSNLIGTAGMCFYHRVIQLGRTGSNTDDVHVIKVIEWDSEERQILLRHTAVSRKVVQQKCTRQCRKLLRVMEFIVLD